MSEDKNTPSEMQLDGARDAIRFAMEARHGGAVSDLPTGPRNWGEADGYWITMHVDPVLDALVKLGWCPAGRRSAPTPTRGEIADALMRLLSTMSNHGQLCPCWTSDAEPAACDCWARPRAMKQADAVLALLVPTSEENNHG